MSAYGPGPPARLRPSMQCALLACCEVYAAVQSHLHCCLRIAPHSAMDADVAWPMERSLLKAALGGRCIQHN